MVFVQKVIILVHFILRVAIILILLKYSGMIVVFSTISGQME